MPRLSRSFGAFRKAVFPLLTDTLVNFLEAAVAASLAFKNTLFMFDPANFEVEFCAWRFLEERGWERTVLALLRIIKNRASGCCTDGLYMHNGDNLKLRKGLYSPHQYW
jgi:hypothetical protein